MYALTTPTPSESLSAALIYRMTDGQVDHPTPPAQDDDDEEVEKAPKPDVAKHDGPQPAPKGQ